MRKTFDQVQWALGALLSFPAVVSVLQHGFRFELATAFADFVNYYRALSAPVFDALYYPLKAAMGAIGLDWTLPAWLRDLHTISFVGAGLQLRARLLLTDQSELNFLRRTRFFLVAFLQGLTGVGLIYVLLALDSMFSSPVTGDSYLLRTGRSEDRWRVSRESSFNLTLSKVGWATLAAVVGFYAANALLLSV